MFERLMDFLLLLSYFERGVWQFFFAYEIQFPNL